MSLRKYKYLIGQTFQFMDGEFVVQDVTIEFRPNPKVLVHFDHGIKCTLEVLKKKCPNQLQKISKQF